MQKSRLQTVYFVVFLLLVIIPVTGIGIGSLSILRRIMLDSAVSKVQLAQENVSSVLSTEIKNASLQLAHLLYVNNGQIISLAARTQTEDLTRRYEYITQLTTAVNYVIKPVSEIKSLKFYMSDGSSLYLKEEIDEPYTLIKKEPWYQAALDKRGTVHVGAFLENAVTGRNTVPSGDTLIIVAAMSPDMIAHPQNTIETVALFIRSQADNVTAGYNYSDYKEMGFMYITDRTGKILVQQNAPKMNFSPNVFESKNSDTTDSTATVKTIQTNSAVNKIIITEQPDTGWKIISVVDTQTLLQNFYRIAFIIIAVSGVLLILFMIFSRYFLKTIIHPVNRMIEGLTQVEAGDFSVNIEPCGHSEVRKMIDSFNHTVSRLKTVNEEKDRERQLKYNAELKALQSQINPHFLVNALTSIRFMAQVAKFDSLRKMAEALIKILTCSFRSNSGFYPLREELDVLAGFIYLMQIRYSDNFKVEYEIDETCLDCSVPRLILQPLVENAIVHAFNEMEDPGCIRIRIKKIKNYVQICIEDNGCGMSAGQTAQLLNAESVPDDEPADYTSIGIKNVHHRLILNFGSEYGLSIHSIPGQGTNILLRIPYHV